MKFTKNPLPFKRTMIERGGEDLSDYVRILLGALNRNYEELEETINYNNVDYVESGTVPQVRKNTVLLWKNTETGKFYLVASFNGVVKKVEMT